MIHSGIPNFRGWLAAILHRPDDNAQHLCRQLERLGLTAQLVAPDEAADALRQMAADVVFFDADIAYDGMMPWQPGEAPVPLIALMGSEAPGRLAWLVAQDPDACMQKPILSAGAYAALTIATQRRAARLRTRAEIAGLNERLSARPLVIHAVLALMAEGMSAEAAQTVLRRRAMAARRTVEQEAVFLLASDIKTRRA